MTTTPPDHPLLWLDLETTGVDETKDSIIEVGVVVTTSSLSIDLGEWVSYAKPTDEALGRMMRTPAVLEMHEANGLYDELMLKDLPTIGRVDHELCTWLDSIHSGQFVLAGSGVGHFDRRFIKAQMPKLDRRLRHWCIDVGVLRRAYGLWSGDVDTDIYGTTVDPKTHRALDDAYIHLAEARRWRDFFVAATTDMLGERFL